MKSVFLLTLLSLFFLTDTVAKEKCPLRVMTFNIRMANPSDGDNYWEHRKDYAADLVRFYNCDVIGMQEVLYKQLTDLNERLTDYEFVGVGREDGKTKGEYCPIYYKKERFRMIESGNFWLSENPENIGEKGWDAACERVATWAVFQDKKSKEKFFFLNTHLDHVGKTARREGVKLVLKKAEEYSKGLPVIITGDFNATPDDEPIRILTSSLTDSRSIAGLKYGPDWSFHDFGRIEPDQRSLIDYIFLKGNFKVISQGILTENKGKLFPSDHAPVIATIILP